MEYFQTPALFASDLLAFVADTPVYRYHYADMADMPFADHAPPGAWDDTAWNSENKFRGGTIGNAVQLTRQGWPEGAETARRLRDGVQAAMPERRRIAAYGIAGAVPCVARAIAGNPMNMRRVVLSETAQRPIITLVCDIAVNSGFPADDLLKHAAAVAAIVDLLEDGGFRCGVIVVARVTGKVCGEVAVQLKAPEQPLNLAVMAYGLGHPSFWRRNIFAIWQGDAAMQRIGGGLGVPKRVQPMPEHGTFTIGAASRAGDGISATARFGFIMAELGMQGCPGIPQG